MLEVPMELRKQNEQLSTFCISEPSAQRILVVFRPLRCLPDSLDRPLVKLTMG